MTPVSKTPPPYVIHLPRWPKCDLPPPSGQLGRCAKSWSKVCQHLPSHLPRYKVGPVIIILLLLYKIIFISFSENSIRDESSVFKISKLDSPKRIRVSSLVSDQEYQIWLEAYLTNGKTIQSNVLTFHTDTVDPSALPTTRDEGMMEEHSYYSSMVAAAIVATFALMGLAIILYFYLRRHTTYKVAFDIDHTMAFNVLLDAKSYVFSGNDHKGPPCQQRKHSLW